MALHGPRDWRPRLAGALWTATKGTWKEGKGHPCVIVKDEQY